jgi:hypothetical protein
MMEDERHLTFGPLRVTMRLYPASDPSLPVVRTTQKNFAVYRRVYWHVDVWHPKPLDHFQVTVIGSHAP